MSAIPAQGSAMENGLLAALSDEELKQLRAHSEVVLLPAGQVLYNAGEPIRHVYFPLDSVIFLLATMADGATAEIGLVGPEGMLGTSVSLGVNTTPTQAVVSVPNRAVRMRAETLKSEFDRGGKLQHLLLRYTQALFVQVAQTAACGRTHDIGCRLSRWLLLVHDRLRTNDLPLTQEFIAHMLGTHRPYVTVAAGILQKEGVIHCTRGHIHVLERARLEACACECYRIIKDEFNRLLGAANVPRHNAQPLC